MRVMTSSLLAGFAVALAFSSAAQAQYFYEGPQKPEVEIDLSVLNDPTQSPTTSYPSPAYATPPQPAYSSSYTSSSEYPAPITAPVPPVAVEQAPLLPMVSPYENRRVVDRVELDGANPYIGQPAPSPFSPPALIKPPQPRGETPRTAPATVFKPSDLSPVDGGAPVVVEAAPEQGVEMPAIVVTQDVVESKKRTAGNKPKIIVQKPVRKPSVLSLAREQTAAPEPQTIPEPVPEIAQPAPAPTPTPAAQEPAIADLSPVEQTAEPAAAPLPAEPIIDVAVAPPAPHVDVLADSAADTQPEPLEPPAPPDSVDPMAALVTDAPPAEAEAPLPEVQKTAEMVIDDLYTLPTVKEVAPPRPAEPTPANATKQTIAFQDGSATLDSAMIAAIDVIAEKLEDSDDGRLLIKGYASGADGDRAAARRLSVSRALAVRSHLMDKGIKPSRVDVRGLGTESDTTDTTQLDRVDLVLIP